MTNVEKLELRGILDEGRQALGVDEDDTTMDDDINEKTAKKNS